MIRFATVLQSHWDWRAAGNFVLGGTGSALLALTATQAMVAGRVSPWPTLLALALIGAGLGCVWLEIGRPWRALNVFRHPQRSWMTREGMVGTLVMAAGLAAAATGSWSLYLAAGALGIAFLYCQARILQAAKGVPTWREPAIVPLIVATGLAEGSGVLAVLAVAAGRPRWLPFALAVLALLRWLAWRRYRAGLQAAQAPAASQARLAQLDRWLGAGAWVAAALAVATAFAPPPLAPVLLGLAGLAVVAAGWAMKAAIVTRAAQLQGYAFGRLRHGHPLAHSPTNSTMRTTR
ncbi:MAG: DmsC/YnfH family molybdoenzyme membrane anchor subunit [Burkholderiaceae bacterium]